MRDLVALDELVDGGSAEADELGDLAGAEEPAEAAGEFLGVIDLVLADGDATVDAKDACLAGVAVEFECVHG